MQDLLNQALKPAPGLGPALLVNSTVYLLGIRVLLAGLLPSAVALSWVLGTVVYAAFGLGGYVLVCMYFILGSAVRISEHVECARLSIAHHRTACLQKLSPVSTWMLPHIGHKGEAGAEAA